MPAFRGARAPFGGPREHFFGSPGPMTKPSVPGWGSIGGKLFNLADLPWLTKLRRSRLPLGPKGASLAHPPERLDRLARKASRVRAQPKVRSRPGAAREPRRQPRTWRRRAAKHPARPAPFRAHRRPNGRRHPCLPRPDRPGSSLPLHRRHHLRAPPVRAGPRLPRVELPRHPRARPPPGPHRRLRVGPPPWPLRLRPLRVPARYRLRPLRRAPSSSLRAGRLHPPPQ